MTKKDIKKTKRRRRESSLDPELSGGIIAIVLIIFAIVVTLSFFGKAGAVGIMLNDYVLSFLFGSNRYLEIENMIISLHMELVRFCFFWQYLV